MRVELSVEAFTEEGYEHIVRLIHYFVEGRHEWTVDASQLDTMDEYFRKHAPTRAGVWGALARKGSVSQAWKAGSARPPAVRITRESLRDHAHDLGAPARIVVENRAGDGAFLLAVAHVFGDKQIIEAKARRWLTFVQGGGSGEIPKVVRDECEEFRRVKRVVFLFDSDRMTPDERSKHENIAEKLRAEGVEGHILRFREVENYVPDRVVAAVSVHHRERRAQSLRITHLRKLAPEQRAHFDMKKGFRNPRTRRAEILPAQRELYRSLEECTVVALGEGFGEGLTEIMLREAQAGNLRESDFASLGSEVCEELREILALIKKVL
ncbi:hypothetical protein ACSNOI_34465 [Actinomadura kijaniata]|uniref:hypothetical protein n=1 Tax=Actinomadura kijaniata TaxID=46161 RepID=UPI003F1CE46B